MYGVGASIVVAMFPIVACFNVITGETANPVVTLSYLVLSPIVGAFFLSVAGVVGAGALSILAMVAVPFLAPQMITLAGLLGPLSSCAKAAALAVILLRHRQRIELERRRASAAAAHQLQLAFSTARMGWWDWTISTDRLELFKEAKEILGTEAAADGEAFAWYLSAVHLSDRDEIEMELRRIVDGVAPEIPTHRIMDPATEPRWAEVHAQLVRDESGRPERLAGILLDVT